MCLTFSILKILYSIPVSAIWQQLTHISSIGGYQVNAKVLLTRWLPTWPYSFLCLFPIEPLFNFGSHSLEDVDDAQNSFLDVMLFPWAKTRKLFTKFWQKVTNTQTILSSRPVCFDEFRVLGREGAFTRVRLTHKMVCQGWDVQEALNRCIEVASVSVIFETLHCILCIKKA